MSANTKLSRYSLMQKSSVVDEITGEVYPDVLTPDYAAFEFTTLPTETEISPVYKEKPFYIAKDFYDFFVGDDILLDLNLIPHISFLEAGSIFYVPSLKDFNSFVKLQTSISKSRRKL